MHHDLARSLHFLQAVECDVVEVAGAVQISLLVPHDLFEKVVTASLALLLLEQQVVSRRDLVMLVVLNICDRLVQVTVRTDP